MNHTVMDYIIPGRFRHLKPVEFKLSGFFHRRIPDAIISFFDPDVISFRILCLLCRMNIFQIIPYFVVGIMPPPQNCKGLHIVSRRQSTSPTSGRKCRAYPAHRLRIQSGILFFSGRNEFLIPAFRFIRNRHYEISTFE